MPIVVNVVTFQAPTGGGSSDVTDPDAPPNATPTAFIAILSGHRAPTAYGVHQGDSRLSIGWTDFTDSRSLGVMGTENGAAAGVADAAYRTDAATVIQLPTQNGPGLEVEATATAGVGKVTLAWSSGSQFNGIGIFVYGAEAEIAVENLTSHLSLNGVSTSAALGRRPDIVFGATVGQAFPADTDPANSGAENLISFGWLTNSDTQACIAGCAEDKESPTSVGSIIRDDAMLVRLTSAAGTVTEGPRLEGAMTSTGFTITTRGGSGSFDSMFISLYLGGVRTYAGVQTLACSTTGNKAVTGFGFKPRLVMYGAARIATVNTLATTQSKLCLGVSTASVQADAGWWARDNIATAESHSVASISDVIHVMDSGSAYDYVANMVSHDSDGVTLNVSDAAAADRPVAYLAIGEQLQSVLHDTEHRRWRRQLARM